MPHRPFASVRSARAFATPLAALGLLLPAGAVAQATGDTPADSIALVEQAREAQQNFEHYRQSHIPVERERRGGMCDRMIGRICIWFGGEGEADYPPESIGTGEARRSLIGRLLRVRHQIADPWVVGQLVRYMVEAGEHDGAEQVAGVCGIEESWWCSALHAYSRHVRGDVLAAEAAFEESLAAMPAEELRRWTTPRWVLTDDGVDWFDALEPGARERQRELFWRLSDPLFLVDGNDRWTDHLARLVEARLSEDAEHPQAMEWDVDLEETLIRYGRIAGWSRVGSPRLIRPGDLRLSEDTRRVIGHHHPQSRGYLFPEDFLESPADIPPESWITAPRESRTWYAPPYAPDMRALDTQVGRFRRGDQMLVVGAYRPATGRSAGSGDDHTAADAPAPQPAGAVEAGLFLVPVDGGSWLRAGSSDAEDVLTLRAPPGRYISSLEVLDRGGRRAWRARQGVRQDPLDPGEIGVSDLLILRSDAPFPGDLEEAIPHVRPGIEVGPSERFGVVWEVYGLEVREPVQVTLGFTRGRPGFLTRVGEFLGILEPDRPIEVAFSEAAGDEVETVFRAIIIELPDVEAGEYTLHLRLETAGREPVIASRPILVVE
jgi:hypothetical protein